MVVGAAIIGEIEKPQILSRAGAIDSSRGCEEKRKSMAGEEISLRNNREDEGSCKRERRIGETDRDSEGVKGTADGERGIPGENENRRFNGGVAE